LFACIKVHPIFFQCLDPLPLLFGGAAFHQFQISENRETEIIYYLDGWLGANVDVAVCWVGGREATQVNGALLLLLYLYCHLSSSQPSIKARK